MQILFDSASTNLDSPTFILNPQKTIIAVGMQPGDYITFEAVLLTKGDPASACGCFINRLVPGSVKGVEELQCPTCESDTPQLVRLTERNPVVVLDAPQGTLLRAIYHGTGIDMRTVTVAAYDSTTKDLTDSMRGCPPVCCEDEPQTWVETGVRRCNDATETVEVLELSNCGNYRWSDDPVPPSNYWVATGEIRCVERFEDGSETPEWFVEQREENPCGEARWIEVGPAEWHETGVRRCDDGSEIVEVQEVNQCGHLRWVADPNPPSSYWTQTGEIRCSGETVEAREVNPCGESRWEATDISIEWLETGTVICSVLNDVDTWIEETNQCGTRRLVSGPAQAWQETGVMRCRSGNVYLEERNQCQRSRWALLGPEVWEATGVRRCTGSFVDNEEANQCGQIRWVSTTEPVIWLDTGERVCVGGVYYRQDISQCGTLRWIDSGQPCPPQTYTILTITPVVATISEGQQACWNVELDQAVQDSDLTLVFTLTGSETNFTPTVPTLTIPVGSSTGQVCVLVNDDSIPDEGVKQLCITANPNVRIAGASPTSCINVTDNEAPTYTVSSIGITPAASAPEGTNFCWTVTLNAPVAGADVHIPISLTGDEQTIHNYTIPGTLVIPVGSATGQVCVQTVDDAVDEPDRALTMNFGTNPVRLPTFTGAASTATVLDNDASTVSIIDITSDKEGGVDPGDTICYTVHLNAPAPTGGFPFTVTVSGDSTPGGNVCGSHDGTINTIYITALSSTIPAGAITGTVCYTVPAP